MKKLPKNVKTMPAWFMFFVLILAASCSDDKTPVPRAPQKNSEVESTLPNNTKKTGSLRRVKFDVSGTTNLANQKTITLKKDEIVFYLGENTAKDYNIKRLNQEEAVIENGSLVHVLYNLRRTCKATSSYDSSFSASADLTGDKTVEYYGDYQHPKLGKLHLIRDSSSSNSTTYHYVKTGALCYLLGDNSGGVKNATPKDSNGTSQLGPAASPKTPAQTPSSSYTLRCDGAGDGWYQAARYSAPHTGIDVKCNYGSPILAIGSGRTLRTGINAGGYGYWTETEQVVNGQRAILFYAHLSKSAPFLNQFSKGQSIGTCGDSGNAKGTVTHTHVEVETLTNGRRLVNPTPWFENIGMTINPGVCRFK